MYQKAFWAVENRLNFGPLRSVASHQFSKSREIFVFLSNGDLTASKYTGCKVQIRGTTSFWCQTSFTEIRWSEYASHFSPILAGFKHREEKITLQNQWLPDRAYTNIFVTSAPRASFWPSLAKFHVWLFPCLVDSYAELVLSFSGMGVSSDKCTTRMLLVTRTTASSGVEIKTGHFPVEVILLPYQILNLI